MGLHLALQLPAQQCQLAVQAAVSMDTLAGSKVLATCTDGRHLCDNLHTWVATPCTLWTCLVQGSGIRSLTVACSLVPSSHAVGVE